MDRYYIGSTQLKPTERLDLHLSKHYGKKKFTSRAADWSIYVILKCHNIVSARMVERHVKNMKSRKYIENIKKYTELIEKLIERYADGTPR